MADIVACRDGDDAPVLKILLPAIGSDIATPPAYIILDELHLIESIIRREKLLPISVLDGVGGLLIVRIDEREGKDALGYRLVDIIAPTIQAKMQIREIAHLLGCTGIITLVDIERDLVRFTRMRMVVFQSVAHTLSCPT